MKEENDITKRLKKLTEQSKALSTEIRRLRKLKKKVNSTEKINWKKIVFQKRIYDKVWDWASPHSKGNGITLSVLVCYIEQLPCDKSKIAKSIEEIKKLQKLPEEDAIKKARSYINNKRNAIHRNGNRWS